MRQIRHRTRTGRQTLYDSAARFPIALFVTVIRYDVVELRLFCEITFVGFALRTIFSIQVLRNGHALNLVRALEDLENLRIAHELLNRVILAEAIAAEHLHRIGSNFLHAIGDERLDHGAFAAHQVALVHQAHAVVHHDARSLGLDGHVGQQSLHHLEVDKTLSKLLALLSVRNSLVDGTLHDADAKRGNESARQVQSVQRDAHALAGLADYSALRHAKDRACRRRPKTP